MLCQQDIVCGTDHQAVCYRELKKIISKDSHIGVVSEAVACTGVLAKGLRKEYSSSARVFVPVLLDKFKDKNTICVNNVSEALSIMHM
jgi:cytoskeleton-associated protein 5